MFQARSSAIPILVTTSSLDSTLTEGLLPALEEAYLGASCTVRAVLLTNPHNPLGQCYPPNVIEGCMKFCKKHDLHLISDEVYALTLFDNREVKDCVRFRSALSFDLESLNCDPSHVHVFWSTSKDFGQSGFRMVQTGYFLFNKK